MTVGQGLPVTGEAAGVGGFRLGPGGGLSACAGDNAGRWTWLSIRR